MHNAQALGLPRSAGDPNTAAAMRCFGIFAFVAAVATGCGPLGTEVKAGCLTFDVEGEADAADLEHNALLAQELLSGKFGIRDAKHFCAVFAQPIQVRDTYLFDCSLPPANKCWGTTDLLNRITLGSGTNNLVHQLLHAWDGQNLRESSHVTWSRKGYDAPDEAYVARHRDPAPARR